MNHPTDASLHAHVALEPDPKKTAKIMLMDDEELNIEILQAFLEEVGYRNFVSTSRPQEALDLLYNERPDVILLDLVMPEVSGFDILTRMQSDKVLRHIPVIMLTAAADAETKLTALKLGATDFLAKPVDSSELVLRLRNTLAAKATLDRVTYCDPLTGLSNRERFHDRLDWTVRFSRRYGTTGAVLQVGLDRFKQVNDALGPAVGDRLLRAVAQRLEESLRDTDVLARMTCDGTELVLSRLGGDEFTVLLPAVATLDSVGIVAQRILEVIAAPFNIAGNELFVTCCIGIALFPTDGTVRDTILSAASIAMRHAKRECHDSYRFYSKELNAQSLHRLSMESELRKAIEHGDLELFYQPKIDLETSRLSGAEALIRWRHPERGIVSPGEFIPLAEECGLIIPLGQWVLRAASAQIQAWRTSGCKPPRISVNVSSHQFRQRDLIRQIEAAVSDTGVPAACLGLELTESAVMEQAQDNVRTLERLRAHGFALAIDDFGTGYSSLSYLKRFPIDELKIDRSFVNGVERDRDNAAIVTAIVVMAHSLGLRVVAEGVETATQLELLVARGCDECQGYLFGRPMPAADFGALLLADGFPLMPARPAVAAS